MIYDLFYNPFGFAMPFFLIAAVIGGWRAKRRQRSTLGIIGSALTVGFITFALTAFLMFAGVMILWSFAI